MWRQVPEKGTEQESQADYFWDHPENKRLCLNSRNRNSDEIAPGIRQGDSPTRTLLLLRSLGKVCIFVKENVKVG